MKRLKIKIVHYVIISTILIFFLTGLLLKTYENKINKKLNKMVYAYLEKDIYNIINDDIYQILKNNKTNYINIYKNSNNEIEYLDYNLDKIYMLTNKVTNYLKNNFNDKHNLKIRIPYLPSNNLLVYNLGPKINIYVNTIDRVFGNISTKVTDYGMNNALLETFINIKIKIVIAAGVLNKSLEFNYNFLINSEIINGKIPSYYGNSIKSSFDIPIKN